METKLYNEKHTKTVLDGERQVVNKKLADVKAQNAQMSREISRNKMFNKKDEDRRGKREHQDKLAATIKDFNRDIEENDIELDKERRRLEDKNLLKKQQETVMQLKQDNNKVHIDISIAESRIKDLEGLKDMSMSQIKDILTEKRKVEKENQDIDAKIQGRGMSEQEQRAKQIDAEREQIKKIQNSLKVQKETANNVMERLKEEETKAKDMLDEKIKQQQELNQMGEDLQEGTALAHRNREEIIKLQIRFSQLQTLEEKLAGEHQSLSEENEFYKKKNAEFESENEKLNKEIAATIQKIDINYLLKEIDIEDLRLLAQNNKMMTGALHNLLSKWESIQKLEAEPK